MAGTVEIIFTCTNLIAQHGAGPKRVTQAFAERCIQAGKARYLSTQPPTNPDIDVTEDEKDKIRRKYARNKFMSEDAFTDDVCWVTGSTIPQEIMTFGFNTGFNIKLMDAETFSSGDIIKNPFVILSSI